MMHFDRMFGELWALNGGVEPIGRGPGGEILARGVLSNIGK